MWQQKRIRRVAAGPLAATCPITLDELLNA
jgi:hypothetical protein